MVYGYTDAVSMTTIGAGAVTYIVGQLPVPPLVLALTSWRFPLRPA